MTETELLLLEILERVKKIEARSSVTCSEDKSMLIAELHTRLSGFFDKASANAPGPFAREIVQRLRLFTLNNLDRIQAQAEQLFDDGKFAAGVDFLTAFAKGNLGLPRWMRLFVSEGKLLDQLATYLKANADLFKQGIGALPPTAP